MLTVNKILIHLQVPLRRDPAPDRSDATFVLLLTGLGSSLYLKLTHTWFLFLFPTVVTLF